MQYFLGIDIGTYQTKGVITDEQGTICGQATRSHEMIVPQSGWAEHQPDTDWWGEFIDITQELLLTTQTDPKSIAAVATSAIGPCMLPVDADGNALMNGVLYGVDTRAHREIDDLNAQIGPDRILHTCGNALTSQSVGPKILWLKHNRPEIFEQASKIVTSTTFVVQRLTGECVIDHYTAANFSPLYDVGTQNWTTELAPDIIALDKLPRLLWSTDIAGTVTERAAGETGLAVGTPVTCGTIDAASEAISAGVRHNGDMMMMYGSTIFIIQVTQSRVQDDRLWYAPWLYENTHASMAGLSTSGTLTHWFRDQFAADLPEAAAFSTLAKEAGKSPVGAKGLIVLPYFSGERTPIYDTRAKGTIFGLDLTHTRGDIYRAVIEGIAMGTAHVIDTYRDVGHAPRRILAVGGGTNNETWLKSTSDFGNLPQIIPQHTVGASFGNAFLAACAVGAARPDDIDAWNPPQKTVAPMYSDVHAKHNELFRKLYQQTRDIAHALDAT